MDYDGTHEVQLTHYASITTFPAVSTDNTKLAFTTYAKGQPQIFVHAAVDVVGGMRCGLG